MFYIARNLNILHRRELSCVIEDERRRYPPLYPFRSDLKHLSTSYVRSINVAIIATDIFIQTLAAEAFEWMLTLATAILYKTPTLWCVP